MNEINLSKIKSFERSISESKVIAIIPHSNPDGDAIGSTLGLCRVLENMGKDVVMISPTHFPEFLKWMPGAKKIKILGEKTKSDTDIFLNVDLLIGVDFNALNRISNIADRFSESKANKILIDHHPDPENFTNLLFSD
ncbi:DHH family phosphoesterase, partial [Bacteroidales bacterium OttesenSCG-928-I21]|nr:DHH family phosphoesterase [Bacteroidales bacterium OttesenSCG-928-I21]